ncbi:DUF2894 domain-containing protein [Luteimonas huabeiensis]|uniref:DUF2894 domain-containing protein n=1 Tax=Luteimonas huabeiensis TaxID=1244513 RepID=UPI0004635499|nr:DUF2894 domain-containing protein [Luteimonas huabeiensis]
MRADDAAATLAAWRAAGADRLDPWRLRRIEAMHRRAAQHDGQARRLLDARLAALIADYAADLANTPERADAPTCAPVARGPLGALADALAQRAAAREPDRATGGRGLAEPAALDALRGLWTQIRAQSQLRRSLAHAPEDAGPLNSDRLVHRALLLMRERSPGYLQHFLSHLDTLCWLEPVGGGTAPTVPDAPRAAAAKRPRRRAPR